MYLTLFLCVCVFMKHRDRRFMNQMIQVKIVIFLREEIIQINALDSHPRLSEEMQVHIRKFFINNSITSSSIISTVYDADDYLLSRRQILALTTKSEHARASRIASQMQLSQIDSTTDPLVKAKLLKRQQKQKSIIVHYNYERRFAYYKSKIHHFWNAAFPITTCIDTKLIVGTRNNPNLTKELVRRSPPRLQQGNKSTKPPNNLDNKNFESN